MKKQQNLSKGFTLTEMVVVIIIIGILAAMALAYYGRLVERMRTTEVVQLMATSLAAQERTFLKRHHYVTKWTLLDSGPLKASQENRTPGYVNDDATHFYTNAHGSNSRLARPGFDMYFEEIDGRWFLVADRIGWGLFDYSMVREFETTATYCVPAEGTTHDDTLQMCADFMGVETPEEIPEDPRIALRPEPEEP